MKKTTEVKDDPEREVAVGQKLLREEQRKGAHK
jgi:hypothetical protein